MRVVQARAFGGPEVLHVVDLPTPEPGIGQVLVEVAASGVGTLDAAIRAGRGPEIFPITPPYVPGGAVAGTVRRVGRGVDGSWLGRRVVGPASASYGGGYADVALPYADSLLPIPDGVSAEVAAALYHDGSTALGVLEKTPVGPGDRLLVLPALGGLGSLAVQLARAAGAHVIAGVRGPEKAARATWLAHEVVDYGTPGWPGLLGPVDVVYDGVGGRVGAEALSLLVPGGRFSCYGTSSGEPTALTRDDVTAVDTGQLVELWSEQGRRAAHVLGLAAAGALEPVIGATYRLADAALAHRHIEDRRVVGKLLLVP
jgi:NADPH:quinone reductase-like Zn-dependent oxidoreductase